MTFRIPLPSETTHIQPVARLAGALGLDPAHFWIKRDDLIGLGGGGNKVRKLVYSTARALESNADTLVTTGAPQSNHARLTAAAGARLGLDVVLVLSGEPVEPVGNVLLGHLFGARIVWSEDRDPEALADEVVQELEAFGGHPYRIPFGGSDSGSAQVSTAGEF